MAPIAGALVAMGFFRSRTTPTRSSSRKKPTITKREKIIPPVAYFAINKDIEKDDIKTIIEQAVKHSYAHAHDDLEVQKSWDLEGVVHRRHGYNITQVSSNDTFTIQTIYYETYSDYDVLYFNISERSRSQVTELVFLDYFDRYIEPILYDRSTLDTSEKRIPEES